MKKKFRKLLSEKCKDMGLTDKALDDLVEIGAEAVSYTHLTLPTIA